MKGGRERGGVIELERLRDEIRGRYKVNGCFKFEFAEVGFALIG